MPEKLDKLKEKGVGFFAWCGKHKVISIVIVFFALGLIYNNVIAKNGPLGSATSASADQASQDQEIMSTNVQAFIEEFGCYSYMDVLDTAEMEKYAHEDLCKAVVGERTAAYIYPGEAFGEQAAQEVAQGRMRDLGLVKACDLKSMSLISQESGTFQIRAELEEFCFTNDKGMQKSSVTYILEVRKSEGAGTNSPYEVIRIFKE